MNTHIRIDTAQLRQSIESLKAAYPELADDPEFMADVLEGETDYLDIISRLTDMALDDESMAEAIGIRQQAFAARKARYTHRAEVLRGAIQSVMEMAGQSKVTLPHATISVSHRKPAPIIADEAAVPDSLCKFKRAPDLAAIKAAYERDGALPAGVTLSNGKSVLAIRTK